MTESLETKIANTTNQENEIAIGFYNVTKTFKKFVALDNVSFEIKKGQFHGFVGSNGAGKSTSIRCLLGFYPDTKGKMIINGIASTDPKSKLKIGYIPEEANFPKVLKMRDYLYHFACLSQIDPKEAKEKIEKYLIKYNMTGKEFEKSPYKMSSGQKKKVMLIQALINDPDLLILDEPAANLDPIARNELFSFLKEQNDLGKTIFISSHILSELEEYVDSFTVMEKGKVIESTTISNVEKKLEFNWLIVLSNQKNQERFLELLSKNKIAYQINEKAILVAIHNDEVKNNLITQMAQNNISFKSFAEYKASLKEIYFSNKNIEKK
ncbi:ABC transporter, ATP-binding protein [Metamycoplasma arthritidis]|uniref:ABC transporter ATP-binding protein n=1 Tax=Metamycoplasma arthritidis (strain 158L3-1) TaxID=243272 RepID=B3PM25_META1|nr:ABC transporter ATP-binding protein [Metamycoplasma arthritidis]ACF07077.1 ABC transporter ATP-binding protein [Metamycoplasma arthritidis 158L3-1]VEU78605.1 ABC transporter, ATP-binding protein [Metamycoplasma arthritidis]